jgi:hypothetical protein
MDSIVMQQSLAKHPICKVGCKSMATSTQKLQLSQEIN